MKNKLLTLRQIKKTKATLLKENWYFSYILPNKLLGADYSYSIREYINQNATLLNLIDLSKNN